jgi:hypothetical protein
MQTAWTSLDMDEHVNPGMSFLIACAGSIGILSSWTCAIRIETLAET